MPPKSCRVSLFITATDTNAGKTYISSMIIRALRSEGINAVGYKPICCGDRNDALVLAEASGGLDVDQVNPLWYKSATAPHVAAMLENKPITRCALIDGFEALAVKHDVVVVEGVGGWLVPLDEKYFLADFAKELGLPTILVVRNILGALNHTLLTVESMRARGVEPAGLIFNTIEDEQDTAKITNKGVIEQLCGVDVLTDVIHEQDSIEAWPFLEILERGKDAFPDNR